VEDIPIIAIAGEGTVATASPPITKVYGFSSVSSFAIEMVAV